MLEHGWLIGSLHCAGGDQCKPSVLLVRLVSEVLELLLHKFSVLVGFCQVAQMIAQAVHLHAIFLSLCLP
jgi:hypothetical protein